MLKRVRYTDKTEYRFAWVCQLCKQADLFVWFFTLGRYDTELFVKALCYDSFSEWWNAEVRHRSRIEEINHRPTAR